MKLVIVSDTHGKHSKIKLPDGDLLIHCGDFTMNGSEIEVIDFLQWLGSIETNYQKVLFIPGNHDHYVPYRMTAYYKDLIKEFTKNSVDLWLETYEKGRTIQFDGYSFYGFPFVPFPSTVNGFFVERKEHKRLVKNIIKCDVLVSHGPVYGIHDIGGRLNENLGSKMMLAKVKEINPKLFLCGHIHEGHGVEVQGDTTFINAALLDYPNYNMTKEPIVYELP